MNRSRPVKGILAISLLATWSCTDTATLLTPDAPQHAALVAPQCFGRNATIYIGNPGAGTITPDGTGGYTITGTAGNDVIVGGPGNDIINAGDGTDRVCSGDGNDLLSGGNGTNYLDGELGRDGVDYSAATEGVGVNLATGTGRNTTIIDAEILNVENIIGSPFDDVLRGNALVNSIRGGDGADALYGVEEADVLLGQAGNDVLSGGDGADDLRGGLDDDEIVSGAGADVIFGQEGRDVVNYAGSASVNINLATKVSTGGDAEGDTYFGIEAILGTGGADVFTGDDARNEFDGRGGNDQIHGGAGGDRLLGGTGDDEIHGGSEGDDIRGQEGNDALFGDEGDDNLASGGGSNTVDGGPGRDRIVSGNCLDTVTNVEIMRSEACDVDAATSTVTAAAGSIVANGVESTTITVQLKDAAGNNFTVGGATVVLTTDAGTLSNGGTPASSVRATDQHDGSYTATLISSTSVETARVTATANGEALSDDATVVFTFGTLHHFAVEAAGGGPIAAQASGVAFAIRVTAKDASGNTVGNYAGTVDLLYEGGAGGSLGTATLADGVVDPVSVTINDAGAVQIRATGDGATGLSNAFNVAAGPDAVDDGVSATSVPTEAYHSAINQNVIGAAGNLFTNDSRGFPAARITSFGGVEVNDGAGNFNPAIGDASTNAAGATISIGDGSLTVNANGSFKFDPPTNYTGLLRFKYRLTNASAFDDATVTLAVGVRPSAGNSTYGATLIGNVPINTATSTGTTITAAGDQPSYNITASTGGTAAIAAGKTYSFAPNVAFTGGASFTFTVTNGFGASSPGTVSLTVGTPVWFVNASVAAGGNGTPDAPYNCLVGAGCFSASANLAGDVIYLRRGTYNGADALTLKDSQRVIGERGVGTFASLSGLSWPADAGAQPATGGPSPSLISAGVDNLVLGANNHVYGVELGNSAGGAALTGVNFGTLTVATVRINTNQGAINLQNGTISGAFGSVTSTGGTNAISLTNVNSDAVVAVSGPFSGATGATINVSGGNIPVTVNGDVTQANNAALLSVSSGHTGTLTFQTGTLSMPNGTGLQFDDADGTYRFNGTTTLDNSTVGGNAGVAILNGSSGRFTFAATTSISNPTGVAFRVNDSSPIAVTYPGPITANNGRAIEVSNPSPAACGTMTFSGSLFGSGAAASGILIDRCSSGTMTFSGASKSFTTNANNAVTITNNGATVNFRNGGLALTTSTGTGFTATGGGSIIVLGSNNTITVGAAAAINVQNAVIGTGGFNLQSLTSAGGTNTGVTMVNAGTGGFTVTGVGTTAGSGGTISAKAGSDHSLSSGIGMYFDNTSNISLSNMNFNGGFANFGIRGERVVNFALKESNLTGTFGNTNAPDEGTIRFGTQSAATTGLSGTAIFEGNNIEGGHEDNVSIYVNNSDALNATFRDGVSPAVIGLNSAAGGNDGILIETMGNSSLTLLVDGVVFTGARGDMLQVATGGTSDANAIIRNNTFHNTHSNIVSGGGGITLNGAGLPTDFDVTYLIENNSFRGAVGSPIAVGYGGTTARISGVIQNNIIGIRGDGFSSAQATRGASGGGMGIYVNHEHNTATGGLLRHAVRIANNTISDINDGLAGIYLRSNGDGTSGNTVLEATITGNDIGEMGPFAYTGMYFLIGGSGISGDFARMGLDVQGNVVVMPNSPDDFGSNAFVFDQVSSDAQFYLPGYVPGANGANGEYSATPGNASEVLSAFIDDTKANNGVNSLYANFPDGIVDATVVTGVSGSPFVLTVP